jgi:hypothetical protein
MSDEEFKGMAELILVLVLLALGVGLFAVTLYLSVRI